MASRVGAGPVSSGGIEPVGIAAHGALVYVANHGKEGRIMTTTKQFVVEATSRVVGERDVAAVDHDQLRKLPGAHAAGSTAKEKGR